MMDGGKSRTSLEQAALGSISIYSSCSICMWSEFQKRAVGEAYHTVIRQSEGEALASSLYK